jgi:CheY-like chemotaxis protein
MQERQPARPFSQRNVNIRSLRILVIEDNAIIGMLLTEMLTDMGHDVCGLEGTASGAVATALSQAPDLLIVDARLGADSGVAAVTKIVRSRFIPHVFISGGPVHAPTADTVVLQKPFSKAELTHAMMRALALHA